jgi:hypothetical protein
MRNLRFSCCLWTLLFSKMWRRVAWFISTKQCGITSHFSCVTTEGICDRREPYKNWSLIRIAAPESLCVQMEESILRWTTFTIQSCKLMAPCLSRDAYSFYDGYSYPFYPHSFQNFKWKPLGPLNQCYIAQYIVSPCDWPVPHPEIVTKFQKNS